MRSSRAQARPIVSREFPIPALTMVERGLVGDFCPMPEIYLLYASLTIPLVHCHIRTFRTPLEPLDYILVIF
jgi:hypothetical protein